MLVRDVVANLLHRLGMVGAIVITSALIFGAIAGGVIVHRLDTTPSASEQAQGDESGQKVGEAAKKSDGPKAKQPANNGHEDSSESEDSQDKDV